MALSVADSQGATLDLQNTGWVPLKKSRAFGATSPTRPPDPVPSPDGKFFEVQGLDHAFSCGKSRALPALEACHRRPRPEPRRGNLEVQAFHHEISCGKLRYFPVPEASGRPR